MALVFLIAVKKNWVDILLIFEKNHQRQKLLFLVDILLRILEKRRWWEEVKIWFFFFLFLLELILAIFKPYFFQSSLPLNFQLRISINPLQFWKKKLKVLVMKILYITLSIVFKSLSITFLINLYIPFPRKQNFTSL